jgi:hypothetical protein
MTAGDAGVRAALESIAAAYEHGEVSAGVIQSFKQLLPYSRYVRCVRGPRNGLCGFP